MRLAIIWYNNVYWGCSGKIVFLEDTGNDEKKNYSFLLAMADYKFYFACNPTEFSGVLDLI